jgi:hypothetical protein
MGLVTAPAEWSVQHQPAADTIATISKAANAGGAHVVTSISVGLSGTAASGIVTAQLFDGVKILWSASMLILAGDSKSITLDDLSIRGSQGRAMKLAFDAAGGANTEQTVSMSGYTENVLTSVATVTTPDEISNLTAWFKADRGIVPNGNDVAQWNDQSGNGYNLVQATAAAQPLLNSSDSNFNNQPSISFDGSSEFMATTDFSPVLSQPNTIFACLKMDSAIANDYLWDGIDATNRNALLTSAGADWAPWAGTFLTGSAANTDVHIIGVRYSGGTGLLILDGATDASGSIGIGSLGGLTIAARNGGSQFSRSTFVEIMVYNKTLTNAEMNNVGNYLSSEYDKTWTDI